MTTPQRVTPALLLALLLLAAAAPVRAQDDTEAPVVTHDEVKTGRLGLPVRITAIIEDASGVFDPAVLYRVGGQGEFLRAPMKRTEGEDQYEAVIPGEVVSEDLEYFIEAFDERGNGPARYADADLPVKVPVLKTAEPLPDPGPGTSTTTTPDTTTTEDDGGGAVWVIVGVAAAGLLLAAAATAGVVAFVLLQPPPVPAQVDVVVSAPTPIAAGVTP